MKRWSAGLLFSIIAIAGCAQQSPTNASNKTLLWKISGNGLEKPSYLYGTIHMICAEDALLSKNMKKAIRDADEVYLEVNLDDMMEMLSVLGKLKMNGDTTLEDLLSKEDYEKVRKYFESKVSFLPFSMLETFKPILAASLLEQGDMPCDDPAAMEQVIMKEAKGQEKEIKGLESISYQASIFDSIPYKYQAQQLVSFIDGIGKNGESKEMAELFKAYNEQDLEKLEGMLLKSDVGLSSFTEVLLYNRNRNWVKKLKGLMPNKSLVIAVGAGHLPGDQGVIKLLRKEGYTVEPVDNKLNKSKEI
jgi:uncharacterized protein YbaP (TraB family)